MTPEEMLDTAQDMGLTLPSAAWIVGCILFSLIGLVAWRWGKARRNPRVRWLGLALMLYGYVAGPTWLLYGAGVALCGAVWWFRNDGD